MAIYQMNLSEVIMAEARRAIPIKHGMKVECREEELNQLRNDKKLSERFNLKIKRLNRWWYSVYFDEIEV